MSTAYSCPKCGKFHPVGLGCAPGAEWANLRKNFAVDDTLKEDAKEEAGIAWYKLKKERGQI